MLPEFSRKCETAQFHTCLDWEPNKAKVLRGSQAVWAKNDIWAKKLGMNPANPETAGVRQIV